MVTSVLSFPLKMLYFLNDVHVLQNSEFYLTTGEKKQSITSEPLQIKLIKFLWPVPMLICANQGTGQETTTTAIVAVMDNMLYLNMSA